MFFTALKSIIGEVIPEGQEPFSEYRPDEQISSVIAPAAILARMTPSILLTMFGNKVLVELKRELQEIYEGKPWHPVKEAIEIPYSDNIIVESTSQVYLAKNNDDNPSIFAKREHLKNNVICSTNTLAGHYLKYSNNPNCTVIDGNIVALKDIKKHEELKGDTKAKQSCQESFILEGQEFPEILGGIEWDDEPVMESFLKKKLYHGSDIKLDQLKPTAFDMGNSFQKPGWSLFCFDNFECAKRWAFMKMLQNYKTKLRAQNVDEETAIKYRCYWNFIEKKPAIYPDSRDLIKKQFINSKIYVYEIDADMQDIGIGHDSTHNEFTLRNNDIQFKKVEVILTEQEFDNIFLLCDLEQMQEDLEKNVASKGRGILSFFMIYDYFNNVEAVKIIKSSLRSGDLKEGDDIEAFLSNKGAEMKKNDIQRRLKKSLGL